MALDATANTFEAVAREWFEKHSANWEASYSVKLLARLEANVFPWLGDRPIRDIKPPELLSVLRRVESRGALETAHRLMNYWQYLSLRRRDGARRTRYFFGFARCVAAQHAAAPCICH